VGVHVLHRHHQENYERAHVSDDRTGVDRCYEGVDEVSPVPNIPSSLELHVAGATVQHEGPFSEIYVPVSYELSSRLVNTWVKPLYFGLEQEGVEIFLKQHLNEVDADVVDALLTQFNWRCRIAGAYLIALKKLGEYEIWIGKLLLRSDVCFAGKGYCLAIATLNTNLGVEYLQKYLAYYF
jgi:hypothetical protein